MSEPLSCLLCCRLYRGADPRFCSARCRARAAVPKGLDLVTNKPKTYDGESYRSGSANRLERRAN